jgi:ubiquinone/menaquinone biosynthesis C-methylase UbiE
MRPVSGPPDLAELKARMRDSWTLGDYSQLASKMTWQAAPALVDVCAVSAGQELLDVASGNGNVAVCAAELGARVVASDLTPAMVELGRERTRAAGLDLEWVEADVEDLPFEDRSFDCVTSAFGAMFAPRPEVAARELFRVVRPGGTVGMANWTPGGYFGDMFALIAEHVPAAEGVPVPVAWGQEETVRERFGGLAGSIDVERRSILTEWASPEELVDYLEQYAGPHIAARSAIPPERYEELRSRLLDLIREWDVGEDGSTAIDAEYLLVVAHRRG